MPNKLAQFISYVFHPLLMTTGLMAILYFFAPSAILPIGEGTIKPILLMIFLLTYIIPVISVGMLKLTSNISSFKLSERKERFLPFLFVSVYYALTTYLFHSKIVLSNTMVLMFVSVTLTIFLVALISRFYKISVHAAGAAGFLAILIAIKYQYPDSRLFYPIIGAIVILGFVSSARLQLNEHSLSQVLLGMVLGFFVNYMGIFIFA